MFEEWTPDELFALHRRRVERYLPIWFAVSAPWPRRLARRSRSASCTGDRDPVPRGLRGAAAVADRGGAPSAPGGDYFDNVHLLYGRPAQQAGLGKEGQAVYAAVSRIVTTLGDDLDPFVVDASTWMGTSGRAAEQRAAAYRDFHGRPPPSWGRQSPDHTRSANDLERVPVTPYASGHDHLGRHHLERQPR